MTLSTCQKPVGNSMIDIHAHILPGVDDGAADWDVAMEMARQAADSGTHVIYATSHLTVDDATEALFSERTALRQEFNDKLKAEDIDLVIEQGAEWMIAGDLLEHIPPEGFLGTSRSILFEINDYVPLAYVPDFVGALARQGYRPILAHPERYREVDADSVQRILSGIVSNGGILQITAMSLTGEFGPVIQRTAEAIVQAFPASIVLASDAHDASTRKPGLRAGYDILDARSPGLAHRVQSRLTSFLTSVAG